MSNCHFKCIVYNLWLCSHLIDIRLFRKAQPNLPPFAQNGCMFTHFSVDISNLRMQIAFYTNLRSVGDTAITYSVKYFLKASHQEPYIYLRCGKITGLFFEYRKVRSELLFDRIQFWLLGRP